MYPTLEELRTYAKQYHKLPIIETISYDGRSIEDLYLMIREPYTSLFETTVKQGRYSILCLPYQSRIISDGTATTIIEQDQEVITTQDPYQVIEALLREKSPDYLDFPVFHGGLIGHINYDAIRLREKIQDHLPSLHLPMLQLGVADRLILIDHTKQEVSFLVYLRLQEESGLDACYSQAVEQLHDMMERYQACPAYPLADLSKRRMTSNVSKQDFEGMVQNAKQHILAGDIFQIVLSQRLQGDYTEDPFLAYHRLRAVGSTPYKYYLEFSDYSIAGASPELLLKGDHQDIMSVPIAGTRKRGQDACKDLALAHELLADPKENAEHDMLVDLGRNDIGKVSVPGSVHLTQYKQIQRYSHVMHLCSEVHGTLQAACGITSALASLLPAGTLSGAPKIRAMELIEELEPDKREIYGGVIALLGDHLQECLITIRTIVFHQKKAYLQVGAGIVKDSIPAKEYEETLHKAGMLLEALHGEVDV